jgi:hypothetical protein
MTWEAIVRFTPAYDTRAFDDAGPGVRPEMVVSEGALNKLKFSEPTPVVIDHDDERVVGHVEVAWVAEDVDYGTRVRKWHFASCELNEKPSWLERGGGVSWSYHPLHDYTAWGTDTKVLTSCVLREISLLSPGVRPAEPLARVCLVRPVEPPKPQPAPTPRVLAPVVTRSVRRPHSELEELRRRQEWAGDGVDFELICANLQRELGYSTGLR